MSEWNAQSLAAADKIEQFILHAQWEDFPEEVRRQAAICAMDLFDVMICCSHTQMAKNGLRLAQELFQHGAVPIVGSHMELNYMGAVTAYAYNINALDIDDGHNLIKGHPGAVLMAGLWPAAIQAGASYKEFLTALVIGYEVAIRAGEALHKYYKYYFTMINYYVVKFIEFFYYFFMLSFFYEFLAY